MGAAASSKMEAETRAPSQVRLNLGLYQACDSGADVETLEAWLARGADPRHQSYHTRQRYQPLHVACKNQHAHVVRWLLGLGLVDVDSQCPTSQVAPLHLAAEKGPARTVEMLIEAGAQLELFTGKGKTAVQLAAIWGQSDVVRVLVQAGANVRQRAERSGETALHLAARYGHEECVMVLIGAGASAEAIDASGALPRDLAARAGHDALAEMLDLHVAKRLFLLAWHRSGIARQPHFDVNLTASVLELVDGRPRRFLS